MLRPARALALLLPLLLLGLPGRAAALTIDINAGAGLSANAAALAAWGRAADQWEAVFSDPVTVTINADLADLGAGILGQSSSLMLYGGYDLVRDLMVFDATDELGDAIVASLPTAAEFSGLVPESFSIFNALAGTKANFKALGVPDLDVLFGVSDALIDFNTDFSFDFDNSDGVGAGLFDFETIAAHEIGHALGFTSSVDETDFVLGSGTNCDLSPLDCIILMHNLDLFRFGELADPSTAAEFTFFPRELRSGVDAYFDDLANEWAFSTGSFTGDGFQASHWKADDLTGTLIGLMDPTLATGTIEVVSVPDVRALDVIGWDFEKAEPIPEPSTLLLLGAGLGALAARRRVARGGRG